MEIIIEFQEDMVLKKNLIEFQTLNSANGSELNLFVQVDIPDYKLVPIILNTYTKFHLILIPIPIQY